MPDKNEFVAFLKKLEGLKNKTNVQLNIQGPTPLCMLKTNDINMGTNICAAGRTEICVMPNGMISLCPSWPEPFGTINDIDKITGINIRKRLPEKCHNCEDIESCGGACILACTKEGDIYSEAEIKKKLVGMAVR